MNSFGLLRSTIKMITIVASLTLFVGCGNDSVRSEKETFRGSTQRAQLGGVVDGKDAKGKGQDITVKTDNTNSSGSTDILTGQTNGSTSIDTGKDLDTPSFDPNPCDDCQAKCDAAFKYKCATKYNMCHTLCKENYPVCKDVPLVQ